MSESAEAPPPDLRTGQLFYELAHDRLAPSVVKWFKRDIDFSRFRDARDLIAEATRRASLPDRLETLIGKHRSPSSSRPIESGCGSPTRSVA